MGQEGKSYPKQIQSFKKNFCNNCTPEMFSIEEGDPPLQEQFEDAAMDYLRELAEGALEAAMETR